MTSLGVFGGLCHSFPRQKTCIWRLGLVYQQNLQQLTRPKTQSTINFFKKSDAGWYSSIKLNNKLLPKRPNISFTKATTHPKKQIERERDPYLIKDLWALTCEPRASFNLKHRNMLTTLSSSTLKNAGFSSIKEHIVSISRNLIKDDVSLHYLLLVCATLVPLYSFGESKEEKLQVITTPSSALYMDILRTFFKAGCPKRPRKKN